MNRVLALDYGRGIATVQAGIGWPALIAALSALQPQSPGSTQAPWTIIQKQTGADELSIGGALAANAHGRSLDRQPFVQEVEAFRIVTADGVEREVSRTRDPELFRLAIGGYGLLGVITTVDLRLQRRYKLRRDVQVVNVDEVPALIEQRTRDGYRYGDFQFKTDASAADFMTTGVFSFYRPVEADTPMPEEQQTLASEQWRQLFALAHLDKARAYAIYRDYYLKTDGQLYWSDTHQLSYYAADFETVLQQASPTYPAGSLMITEVYVPRSVLPAFMREVSQDFREHDVNLIYGTVRLIRRDDETFLPWARQDYACIVMNLRVTHTPAGLDEAQRAFQRIIDRALARDGSFYLTYHRWARRDQLLQAYPQLVEFLKLKRRYDPAELFQSEWYRHYRTMFAAELAAR
jgi:FAD/FMN-containing dehydrogenase